jgi:hypothetical protein
MEFLKKNYEKVLLALVLLGLTIGVALLPILISSKRAALADKRYTATNTRPKALPELNMTALNTARQRAETPSKLDLGGAHNLFNPVLWQMTADGKLIKVETGKEIGAGALKVTKISPLNLKVSYESSDPTGYIIRVVHDSIRNPREHERTTLVSLDKKSDILTLKKVGGTPDRPELDLELKGIGSNPNESFIITPDKPFEKVEAYQCSLTYPLDSPPVEMKDRRVNENIRFGGGDYRIIEITSNSVRVQDKSNEKITYIPYESSKSPN